MRKLHLLALTLSLTSALSLRADQFLYVNVNTSTLNGTTGSLDFAFDSGALSSQAATVQVYNFTGATFAGSQAETGTATGGPISTAPVIIANNSAFQSNDDFEAVTFGKLMSFALDFSGPAVTSPDGTSTSTSQFAFYLFSDVNGTVPALTFEPTGLNGLVTINPNGMLSTLAYSPQFSASSVPEPASFWLAGIALVVYAFSLNRRSAIR